MREKYPEAARRHLEDSKYLLDDKRWDTSAYLAGYVIECSLKAVITTPEAPPGVNVYQIGHDLQTLAGQLERMAASAKTGFRRSVSGRQLLDLQKQLAAGFQWKETLRYEESGYISPENAKKWWSMANRVFSGLAKDLCEGV
jgi:HEPN domain-containing protein